MATNTITQTPINFKQQAQVIPINYNQRKTPPMPDNYGDSFMLEQQMIRQQQKRERSRDRWNKVGTIASCTIAASLLLSGLAMLTGAKAIGKMGGKKGAEDAFTTAKVIWEDFKGKKDAVADLDSKTTAKSLKEALNKIIETGKLSEKAKAWGGSTKDKADIIYLYGHGGVGKTYVAKQYAQKIDAMFTCIKYPDLGSPYKDAASMKISDMFDNIIKTANEHKDRKIVVCIDEIDAVMRKVQDDAHGALEASKSRAAVLTGLDRVKEQCTNVTVIATSNYHPKGGIVDPIALRRFNNKVEVPLPNKEQDAGLLEMYLADVGALKNVKNFTEKSEYKRFIKKLEKEGYSNGEIELIAKEAAKSFSASLKGVKDAELHKHPFKVKYLEDAKKMVGEPSSKTNKLMDAGKEGGDKPGFFKRMKQGFLYTFFGGRRAG